MKEILRRLEEKAGVSLSSIERLLSRRWETIPDEDEIGWEGEGANMTVTIGVDSVKYLVGYMPSTAINTFGNTEIFVMEESGLGGYHFLKGYGGVGRKRLGKLAARKSAAKAMFDFIDDQDKKYPSLGISVE